MYTFRIMLQGTTNAFLMSYNVMFQFIDLLPCICVRYIVLM
jgi:hypothetical protein